MPRPPSSTQTRHTALSAGTEAGNQVWSHFYRGHASAAGPTRQERTANSLQIAGFGRRHAEIAMPP
jgi:hypothetical protein